MAVKEQNFYQLIFQSWPVVFGAGKVGSAMSQFGSVITTAVAELLTCANLRGNFKFFKQRVGPKKTSQDSHHVNLATLVLTHTYRLYNVHTKRLKMKSPKVRFVESAKITQHLLLALLLHTYETVCES